MKNNIENHLDLIKKVSNRYFKNYHPKEDLYSWGFYGLHDAANKWDGRGKFQCFAIQKIIWSIQDGMRSVDISNQYYRGKGYTIIEIELDERLPTKDIQIEKNIDAQRKVDLIFKNCNELEKSILIDIYYNDLTIDKIAELKGCTSDWISKIISRIKKRMRTLQLEPK